MLFLLSNCSNSTFSGGSGASRATNRAGNAAPAGSAGANRTASDDALGSNAAAGTNGTNSVSASDGSSSTTPVVVATPTAAPTPPADAPLNVVSDAPGLCNYDGTAIIKLNLQTGTFSQIEHAAGTGVVDSTPCQDMDLFSFPIKLKRADGTYVSHNVYSQVNWTCNQYSNSGLQIAGDWSKVTGATNLVFNSTHKQGTVGTASAEIQFPYLIIKCSAGNWGQRNFTMSFDLQY